MNINQIKIDLSKIPVLSISIMYILMIVSSGCESNASEKKSLQDTLALLDQEIPNHLNTTKKKLNFFRDITLSKVSFYYDSPNSDTVYLIDDEFQKSLPILISQKRDEKIDQLLGE